MPKRHAEKTSRPSERTSDRVGERVAAAAQHIDVQWSAARAERIRQGVMGRHQTQVRRRRIVRVAGAAAALLMAALLAPRVASRFLPPANSVAQTPRQGGGAIPSAGRGPGTAEPAVAARGVGSAASLRLVDGSLARADGDGEVILREERSSRVVLEVVRGRAEFSVTKNPGRLFRVEAGGLAVEVLGTQFTVERTVAEAGSRVAVAVTEGRVRVLWAAQYAELSAGERAEFEVTDPHAPAVTMGPPAAGAAASSQSAAPHGGTSAAVVPASASGGGSHRALAATLDRAAQADRSTSHDAARRVETTRWKQLAREGEFEKAYHEVFRAGATSKGGKGRPMGRPQGLPEVLKQLSPDAHPSDGVADLLLLADVARLSHHPAEAVIPLQQLLTRYTGDARAPLAAFTLGRILLDDLGQPREAAESFQRTQTLDPEGPMAQDALAREVEAWSRAGEAGRARERAREYIRQYPSGRRLHSVRHFGEVMGDGDAGRGTHPAPAADKAAHTGRDPGTASQGD